MALYCAAERVLGAQWGEGAGAGLRGRARRAAVPTQRWPRTSRHFPASPRPAPPRPAARGPSPHPIGRATLPPPRPLLIHPRLVRFQSLLPARIRGGSESWLSTSGCCASGGCVPRAWGRAGPGRCSLDLGRTRSCRVSALSGTPEQLSEKRGGLGSPEKGTWEFCRAWQGLTPHWVALTHTTLPPRQREKIGLPGVWGCCS